MIEINNINIKFDDNEIIRDSDIAIEDGKLTVISGKSGTGKTSILYLLGLLTSNKNYDYYFDGTKIDIKNDKITSYYKKKKIGFIFQDNSLIEDMTVFENIRMASEIAGRNLSKDEIQYYLDFAGLTYDGKKYPKQLSTGEQQRVAIACAIAKNPDLIIADEPTSALDIENVRVIMDIFRRYVENKGKKVVIVSHNENVCKEADIVYRIDNKMLICEKKSKEVNVQSVREQERIVYSKIGIPFYLKYVRNTVRKRKIWQRSLMLLFCAMAISFTVVIQNIGDELIENQSETLNNISDREVFLINLTAPIDEKKDIDENISITEDLYEKIINISGIDTVYPYYEFRSQGYDIETRNAISIEGITVIDEKGKKLKDCSDFVIVPYYEEQSLRNQVDLFFDGNESNIFISYSLAHVLGIDSESKMLSLEFAVGVPIATTDTTLYINDGQTYSADIDVSEVKKMSINIEGIVSSNYGNRYSASGTKIIYMPISLMNEYLVQGQSAFEYNEVSDIQLNKWRPSSYLVYAKNYEAVGMIVEKLESIDSNFVAISDYQDIESMNNMLANLKNTVTIVAKIVLWIVFVLMAVIYINYIFSRKCEIALLKANGLTKIELSVLLLFEIIIHVLIMSCIGCLMTGLISKLMNYLFSFQIVEITFTSYFYVILISIAMVMIPAITSIIFMTRVQPDRVMRN